MKLIYTGPLIDNSSKQELAQRLACIISGSTFSPYRPNEKDYNFWVLDEANNWRVQISEYEVGLINIYYRYSSEGERLELAVANYLATRWDKSFKKEISKTNL